MRSGSGSEEGLADVLCCVATVGRARRTIGVANAQYLFGYYLLYLIALAV